MVKTRVLAPFPGFYLPGDFLQNPDLHPSLTRKDPQKCKTRMTPTGATVCTPGTPGRRLGRCTYNSVQRGIYRVLCGMPTYPDGIPVYRPPPLSCSRSPGRTLLLFSCSRSPGRTLLLVSHRSRSPGRTLLLVSSPLQEPRKTLLFVFNLSGPRRRDSSPRL